MQPSYYPYIDGLRALAVLAVILYHLDAAWLPGGFTGVDIFFVISGYVVSASLAKRKAVGLGSFALHFYARRFARILPALLACLLITSLATTLLVPKAWLSDANEWTGLAAFFGISNVMLAIKQDAYYSPRAEFNPFLHTWSLGVEEQFYLLFPLVFFLWVKLQGPRRHWAVLLLAMLASASLAYAARPAQHDPNGAFYLIFSRFWELAAGALLFQLTANSERPLASWAKLPKQGLQWLGLALIGLSLFYADLGNFPLPWALLPVAGSVILILALKGEHSGLLHALFSNRVAVRIGWWSYSLYLWHWPVFSLLRWTTGLETPGTRLLGVSVTLLCAGLSYSLVERPVRKAQTTRRWPDGAVVAGGLATVVLGAALALTTFKAQPTLSLSVTRDAAQWYPLVYSPQDSQTPCALHKEDTAVGSAVRQRYIPVGCVPSGRRLFVLGDSHAGAYLSLLTRFTQEQGDEVWLYTQGGCAYMNLLKPMYEAGSGCADFARSARDDLMAQIRPHDVVFLPSLRVVRFGDQYSLFPEHAVREVMDGTQARTDRARAVEEAALEIAMFVAHGARVILEAPKPIFKAPAFRCSDWFNRINPICAPGLVMPREVLLHFRAPAMAALEQLADTSKAIQIWDPFDLLCDSSSSCATGDGMGPLFFDGDHLTALGNMRVYEDFVRCVNDYALCSRHGVKE